MKLWVYNIVFGIARIKVTNVSFLFIEISVTYTCEKYAAKLRSGVGGGKVGLIRLNFGVGKKEGQ